MSTALASLTAWDWFCIFTAWGLLAIVAAFGLGRRIKHADDTQRAVYPPPVPPSRHSDKDWVSVWPRSVDDVDLLDAEFVSIISATWCWPDNAEDAA